MIFTILLFVLIGWYFVSQFIAEAICGFAGEPPDEDQSSSIRAGMFLLPALVAMILLAYVTWQLTRLANVLHVPLIEQASDNPMEYL
jgi:hypothetical protein